ncbi:MAG: PAS domain-containing sensor histidine kinase [Alphaproteobacteria bacterium]|nr:MAG: PAS domain-containing sensor histidine kinase [Alphaproteobacteria bacterium]
MRTSGFELSNLQDARLAPLATSPLPAWLWSSDAFGASTSGGTSSQEFDSGHPAAAEIIRLIPTLASEAPPRIERLHCFAGLADQALTCACSQIRLRDGTQAVLVVAAERAGPELTLNERVHRLLAGSDECVAIFSAAGQLLCATQRAHSLLGGATTLTALGAQTLAASAVESGYAAGNIGNERISITRVGGEAATVLVVDLAAPAEAAPYLAASQPESGPHDHAGTPPALTGHMSVRVSVNDRAAAERRHPLRFVWQMDDNGRFTIASDEFIELMGAPTAAVMGKPWTDVAADLTLDPEGQIARAVDTHDTWSGLTLSWPFDNGRDRLAIELSGLPVFDRERIFRGYRGFGVCRDVVRLAALAAARAESLSSLTVPAQSPAEPVAISVAAAPSQNVLPFPASSPDSAAPALTAVEHMAFRELSRKLTQGLAAAAIQSDMQAASLAPAQRSVAAPERRDAETASEASALLDRLPTGILIYRLNQLLYANPIFLQWAGYQTLDGLIEAGGLDELFIAPVSAAEAGSDRSVTLRMERGERLTLKGELIGIDWQGEPAHVLITARQEESTSETPRTRNSEIAALQSQWIRTEQDLTEARHRAESASAAKSDFLARISHEIRTPLNSIIGFSEVMMEEKFGPIGNERYREYLKDIHSSGGHLLSLINDLLDLSKIEAGKLQLTFADVALNDIAQQCVATMQPQASRDRIIIRTAFAPALPQVIADARSVRQIVLNLLSNSLKFTPAGGQVIVSTAPKDQGAVVLRVRDTGVGMSEKEIETALEPFRQLATSPRGGTGLGLPLTKAMAEANRAKFQLTSAPKEGTLVEITFPASGHS